MRVLLVEDDPMIGDAVRRGLLGGGFTVDWVKDGRAAQLAIEANQYTAAILDLGLPRIGGLEVLERLRQAGSKLPVIVVTARDAVSDKITGLNLGADDYLTKPFDLDELLARLRALLRRQSGRANDTIECGSVSFNSQTKTVTVDGHPIDLSARELSLLELLMERPGAVLSRDALEEQMFGWGDEPTSNALEVHLHNLRRKIGPDKIRNIRGVGYKLTG